MNFILGFIFILGCYLYCLHACQHCSIFFSPVVFLITCHYSPILVLLLAYEECTTTITGIIDRSPNGHVIVQGNRRLIMLYSSTAKCMCQMDAVSKIIYSCVICSSFFVIKKSEVCYLRYSWRLK